MANQLGKRYRCSVCGTEALCTKAGKFEISNHKNCAGRGLSSAGFAAINIAGKASMTVHFKEPAP